MSKNYILFIDDERDFLEAIEQYMEVTSPVPVRTAATRVAALEIMKTYGEPLAIFSDLKFPDGGGASVFETYNKLGFSCPFVICSACSLPEITKEIPEKVLILQKPSVIEGILEVVRKVCVAA